MSNPKWTLSDDYQAVTLEIGSETLRMNASMIDEVLRNLGEMRAAMTPAVAAEHDLGQKVNCIPDPRWLTEPDALGEFSLLHLRDPRYGWLHYAFPRTEARRLGEYLINQADNPHLEPSSSPAN